LSEFFDNVDEQKFLVKLPKKEYKIVYSISESNSANSAHSSKIFNLTFSFESSRKDRTAEILMSAHNNLINNIKKSDFYLIITYDEVSEYYCNKLYPHLQKFERLLRQLVYIIITKAFGALWVDKTISKEAVNELKKKITCCYGSMNNKVRRDEKIIEEALHHLDVSELETFLFGDRRDVEPNYIIDEVLTENASCKMNKEEILEIINKGRSKSLWDRYLLNYVPIENPRDKIVEIRHERNKVAHSKQFSLNEYKNAKKILDEFNSCLQEAMKSIDNMRYESKIISDTLSGLSLSLSQHIKTMELARKSVSPALSQLADISLTVATLYNPIKNVSQAYSDNMISVTKQVDALRPLLKQYEIIDKQIKNIPALKALLELQKILSPTLDLFKNMSDIGNAISNHWNFPLFESLFLENNVDDVCDNLIEDTNSESDDEKDN